MPKIFIGEPLAEEEFRYEVQEIENVKIYYPARLKVKEGYSAVQIKLKKLFFLSWLELEGAQGVTITS